jgi:hypothetical protein
MNRSLNDILYQSNMNNEVYLSDVHRWIGLDKPLRIAVELQNKLTEVREWERSQI